MLGNLVIRGYAPGPRDRAWLARRLVDYADMLDLAEHDLRTLYARHEADLRVVLLLLDRGQVAAARAIIRSELGR